MHGRASGAVVAVLVVAGACSFDSPQVGDTIARPDLDDLAGDEYVVQTPDGQVTITVGKSLETVEETSSDDVVRAPEGARWVPVQWRSSPGDGLDGHLHTLMGGDVPDPVVRIAAGEEDVTLGGLGSGSPTYVAVPADEDPVLTVEFDGVTSQVDTGSGDVSGEMHEAMQQLPDTVREDCSDEVRPFGDAKVTCGYTMALVPYLRGSGWSTEWWSVALLTTRVGRFDLDGSTYRTRSTEDLSFFSGVKSSTGERVDDPDGQLRMWVTGEGLDGQLTTWVIGEGRAAGLQLSRTVTGDKIDGPGADVETMRVLAQVPLPSDQR